MRILIYGINFSPELTGVGKYTGEMVQWLADRGYWVEVVTAPPYYPAWRVDGGYRSWAWCRESVGAAGRVGVTRCPLWVPRQPRTLSRLAHLLSFAASSLPALAWRLWRQRPQWVMVIVPTMFVAPAALLLARAFGARTWLHVQDFEVDAMFGLGLGGTARGSGVVARWALSAEQAVLRRFDRCSSITPRMVERLHAKGVRPECSTEFPNWVDLDRIRPWAGPNRYRQSLDLGPADVLVLYAGNMGEKQGLETVLEAAAALRDNVRLHWLLAGEGATRERLQRQARELGLPRMHWLPLQPADQLNELLGAADVHVLPQRADAADLVMPSKLTGMLASGRAVVGTAAADTQLGMVLNDVGVRVEPGDALALAKALEQLADGAAWRNMQGLRGREWAERWLARDAILQRLEAVLSGAP